MYVMRWWRKFNSRKSKIMVVGKREGGTSWKIGEEIMEEVEEFKYLRVWFDRKLRGNVHLEKMANMAEEWVGNEIWISSEWTAEVDRGRMVWEHIGRLSVEHAVEVWWSGWHSAYRKLESAQIRVGRRLLGASNTLAGVAVQGDLGWRKLEEGREEMKVLFGKRLEGMEVSQLVKMGVEKRESTEQ